MEYTNAAKKIVVDPCATLYKEAGLLIEDKDVEYINCGVENMPIANNSIDVVIAFNCLDHVDNFELACERISNVIKVGGSLLINVELDHEPTPCEPIVLSDSDVWETFQQYGFVKEYWNIWEPVVAIEGTEYLHHNSRWLRASLLKVKQKL